MADPEDTPAPAEAEPPSRTDEEIERWFVDRIHNSVVSRQTEILNHVRQALDELKQRLRAL